VTLRSSTVRIRVDYFNDVEETDAVHLGPFPAGSGELFRVDRPSLCVAGVAREDVVRLEPDADRYVFWGVVERSGWDAQHVTLPGPTAASGPEYAEFAKAIGDAGGIIEDQRADERGLRLVVSVPAGGGEAWERAYERIIRQLAGVTRAEFEAGVVADAQRADRARYEEQARESRRRHLIERAARTAMSALRIFAIAAFVAVVGWWGAALFVAPVGARPRIAALGMIVGILPAAVASLAARSTRRFMLGAVAAAGAAYFLAGHLGDARAASLAVALTVLFAVIVGPVGGFYALSSVLSEYRRPRLIAWLLVIGPCLMSSIAAVVYAVTATLAGHLLAAAGSGVP